MTVQTKRFIELSDILAVRFTCKYCGVTVSYPISDSKLTQANVRNQFLAVCPSCREPWAELGGSTSETLVTQATVALMNLRNVLHGKIPPQLGFSLALEITGDWIAERDQPNRSTNSQT